VFNLVFCATTATIVSGAMAERTKFSAYCVYSAVISLVIYPIEAHWIWGGGWLAQLGLHDYAGSCAIHMVGGISALIGAYLLGPRIGKFRRKGDGSVEVHSFPGHNLPLGALGVFILWLGWYGFNGAAATSVEQLGSIFLTTTVAPAIATVTCMIFTWVKYGKPDVSMCLNASLAGLVGITAGCDLVSPLGAVIIGLVCGIVLVYSIEFIDHRLHIDDPVGASSVHGVCGILGTLMTGLLSTSNGAFYGHGWGFFGAECFGILCIDLWAAACGFVLFYGIRKLHGLRVDGRIEEEGLDIYEHGESCYN
jgi:Amt family ammonium transporter